jgi:hypothetical protein
MHVCRGTCARNEVYINKCTWLVAFSWIDLSWRTLRIGSSPWEAKNVGVRFSPSLSSRGVSKRGSMRMRCRW